MSQAPSVAFAGINEGRASDAPANVSLKGTTRGLEILISGTPSPAGLGARLTELLAEAPGFFAGSDARIAIDGVLPVGALACLEEVAARFELRIVELGPAARRGRLEVTAAPRAIAGPVQQRAARPDKLAEGTGPVADEVRAPRSDDPRAVPIPALPPALRTSAEAGGRAGAAETSAVPRGAPGAAASDALVSAATALVSAATALTSDPPSGPRAMPGGGATAALDGPAGSAPIAVVEDAACQAAPIAAPAAGAAAAAATIEPGDPGLWIALAAMLAAATGGEASPATAEEAPAGPRLVVGPVRSGRIVDHVGHLIVIGDVNPGAEVRAEGSIIVLGRLRGVAHAAIGRDAGCIIALSLQPQQLRIGRMVARAGDADRPSGGAEIAYATGETIVVERFSGRLPSGLAASM
jgi:septum formation inhibitor MinC